MSRQLKKATASTPDEALTPAPPPGFKLYVAFVWIGFSFALSLIGLWVCFQQVAPLIDEAAQALAQIPNLFLFIFVGLAVTYILKEVVD